MEPEMINVTRNAEETASITVGEGPSRLSPRMACRHGLIAGATGTGKSVTMQVMAEGFSGIGVPVVMADIKGDLGGIAYPGRGQEERARALGMEGFCHRGNPVARWRAGGEGDDAIRATVGRMGPLFLARLLDLPDAQAQSLYQVFKICRDRKITIKDIRDLFGVVGVIAEDPGRFEKQYGRVSSSSLGSLQRALLVLEDEGEDRLFSKMPAFFNVNSFIERRDGRGVINIIDARDLVHSPRTYAMFFLWLLDELYAALPERGDLERPVVAFFLDEAHLLFREAPKVIVERVEKLVKLIRSKGVAVFFATQRPADIPDGVLGQLGNRVAHAMRAFTPRERQAVRAMADTFRSDGSFSVERAMLELGTGEAVVSFLDGNGVPSPARRARVCPPRSMIGANAEQESKEEAIYA